MSNEQPHVSHHKAFIYQLFRNFKIQAFVYIAIIYFWYVGWSCYLPTNWVFQLCLLVYFHTAKDLGVKNELSIY